MAISFAPKGQAFAPAANLSIEEGRQIKFALCELTGDGSATEYTITTANAQAMGFSNYTDIIGVQIIAGTDVKSAVWDASNHKIICSAALSNGEKYTVLVIGE